MAVNKEVEQFSAVVIGSGFGGTIAALNLANFFASRNRGEKVCLLERGQWWISHELPNRSQAEIAQTPTIGLNMREFLQDRGEPYGFWAHPDNVEGLVDLASKARLINKTGLYDYRQIAGNMHVLAASGVGGGSLIYSNVTLEPPGSVYKDWPTERNPPSLNKYFDKARNFIGVNKITTVSGLGPKNSKLDKSRVFQEAARNVSQKRATVTNFDPSDPDFGFAVPLSITDVPAGIFDNIVSEIQSNIPPLIPADLTPQSIMQAVPELGKYTDKVQQNVCQRQGRCVLGCLPGARHTLNKRILSALQNAALKNVLNVQALSEAELIDFDETDQYRVHYKKYDRKTGAVAGREVIQTKIIVVAAGTLSTNELLLKSQQNGLKLSKKLGTGFSPNGDLLGFMKFRGKKDNQTQTFLDNTRGPINTCHAAFKTKDMDFAFTIEDTTISKMVAPLFGTLFDLYVEGKRRDLGFWRRFKRSVSLIRSYGGLGIWLVFFGLDIPRLQRALTRATQTFISNAFNATAVGGMAANPVFESLKKEFEELMDWLIKDHDNPASSPEERLSRYFVFSAMGRDHADGILALNPNWQEIERADLRKEKLQLKEVNTGPRWFERNREIFDVIIDGMKQLAKEIDPNSDTVYVPTWNSKSPNDSSLVVLHPLGGAIMGESADYGVVNSFGQVFRDDPNDRTKVYDKFYVMDGSIVPSALGVNSSLTIAALAFRCSEHLIGSIH